MQVKDAAGKTLYGDAVPLEWQSDDGKHSIGQFDMKSKGLSVYVIAAASGQPDPNIKAGQMQLEIHQDGKKDPIATQVVDQGKPTTIAGLSYTFERTVPVHRPDRGPRPGSELRLGGLGAAGDRALPRLLLPAPSHLGAGPQDIRRQRDPLRLHHEA